MKVPSLNPFVAPQIVCPNCSSIVSPEVKQSNNKKVTEIVYVCVNEEKDCGWILSLSNQYIMGDMMRLKPEELEKRRSEASAMRQFSGQKEASIRQLIAMLPDLSKMVATYREIQEDAAPPAAQPEQDVVGESSQPPAEQESETAS